MTVYHNATVRKYCPQNQYHKSGLQNGRSRIVFKNGNGLTCLRTGVQGDQVNGTYVIDTVVNSL